MMRKPTPEQIAAVMSMMGKRGGPARALALSAERRTEIAKQGARARIAKQRLHVKPVNPTS